MRKSSVGLKVVRELDAQWDRQLATRTDAERATAILHLLTGGPLMKWQIREHLQEPETLVKKTLVHLRASCVVKSVMLPGEGLNNRGWALITWERPAPLRLVDPATVLKPRKKLPPPPTDSFWLNLPRERFTAACVERARQG